MANRFRIAGRPGFLTAMPVRPNFIRKRVADGSASKYDKRPLIMPTDTSFWFRGLLRKGNISTLAGVKSCDSSR